MVTIITGRNINELYSRACKKLWLTGHKTSPRGQETIEIHDAWLTLYDPTNDVITLPERRLNNEYLAAELDWYASGENTITKIKEYASTWEKIANPDGTINSNYGRLALFDKNDGQSQLEWCVEKLRDDPTTRQAIINYNQPRHKYKGNKDFVCAVSQQFRIRNDCLDSIVTMRSNDVIYGLPYDVPWFTRLQQKVAIETNIKLGQYHHYAQSLHCYARHYSMLEDIANNEYNKEDERP